MHCHPQRAPQTGDIFAHLGWATDKVRSPRIGSSYKALRTHPSTAWHCFALMLQKPSQSKAVLHSIINIIKRDGSIWARGLAVQHIHATFWKASLRLCLWSCQKFNTAGKWCADSSKALQHLWQWEIMLCLERMVYFSLWLLWLTTCSCLLLKDLSLWMLAVTVITTKTRNANTVVLAWNQNLVFSAARLWAAWQQRKLWNATKEQYNTLV